MMPQDYQGEGEVGLFFGLSYAHWLVLPRVLMEQMPIEWQRRIVKCLRELGEEFDWQPQDIEFFVTARRRGKLTKLPSVLCEYRHPNKDEIDSIRRKKQQRSK